MEISMTASLQKKIWKLSSLEGGAAALLGFDHATHLISVHV